MQHRVPTQQLPRGIPFPHDLGREGRLALFLVEVDQTIESREVARARRNQQLQFRALFGEITTMAGKPRVDSVPIRGA
jgi:hypothetical protein